MWPQYTYLALILISVGVTIARYGEPKRDRYDFGDLIGAVICLWLLYEGGFFHGMV